jgi:hypothetical protein
VELGGAQDAGRNGPIEVSSLLDHLGGVVAGAEVVGADDRDEEDAFDAALGTGLLQVARRGREELGRFRLVGRGAGGGVDDQVDSLQRGREALAGEHVDAVTARDRHHLVPALAQDLDGGRPRRPVAPATAIFFSLAMVAFLSVERPLLGRPFSSSKR